jgi:predicted nuclease of restriction endonuclease-like RecB superfamily
MLKYLSLDVKVLVPDLKVLVPDLKVLVRNVKYWSRIQKYSSLDVEVLVKLGPKMLLEEFRWIPYLINIEYLLTG